MAVPIAVNYGSVMNCPGEGVRDVFVIVRVMVLLMMAVGILVVMGVMLHSLSLRAEKYSEI